MTLTSDAQRALLEIARSTIRSALAGAEVDLAKLDGLPELHQPAGCFVSLHELVTHRLRGCVGTLDARKPMEIAVREAARSVLRDPRFNDERLTSGELPLLEIEISLLSPLQPIEDADAFDLLKEGIHLSIGERSGCFLPQVARQTLWTREQLLCRLCAEKLRLEAEAWRRPEARLAKFSTLIIGPEPFEMIQGQPQSLL